MVVRTTGEVILMGIAVLILTVILVGPGVEYVKALLEQWGVIKPPAFVQAVRCSYWRCKEGYTGKLNFDVGGKNCLEHFYRNVPAEFRDEEGKICGWNAAQYPVELSEGYINPDQIFTKESFTGMDEVTQIKMNTPENEDWEKVIEDGIVMGSIGTACGMALATPIPAIDEAIICGVVPAVYMGIKAWFGDFPNEIFIPTDMLKEYTKEDDTILKAFSLKKQPVFIHTLRETGFRMDKRFTIVLPVQNYYKINKNDPERECGFFDGKWHRIVIENKEKIEVIVNSTIHDSAVTLHLKSPKESETLSFSQINSRQVSKLLQCYFQFLGITYFEFQSESGKFSGKFSKFSITCNPEYMPIPRVQVWEHTNFEGKSIVFIGNISDLDDLTLGRGWGWCWPPWDCKWNWNDVISSINVTSNVEANITFYEDANYEGDYFQIECKYSPADNRVICPTDNLNNLLDKKPGPCYNCWNDCISSIKIEYDSQPPTYSLSSTNSTQAGTAVEHRLHWKDNSGLSGYIFSFDNCTGNFQDDPWIGFESPTSLMESWSNVTKVINSTVGCTIRWKVTVNDTSNNKATSEIFSYTTTAT